MRQLQALMEAQLEFHKQAVSILEGIHESLDDRWDTQGLGSDNWVQSLQNQKKEDGLSAASPYLVLQSCLGT